MFYFSYLTQSDSNYIISLNLSRTLGTKVPSSVLYEKRLTLAQYIRNTFPVQVYMLLTET